MSDDLEGDWEVTIGREVNRRVETSRKAEFEVKSSESHHPILVLFVIILLVCSNKAAEGAQEKTGHSWLALEATR